MWIYLIIHSTKSGQVHCSLIAIDFAGFGQSRVGDKNFSFDLREQANLVARVLAHEGVKKYAVIGHSMGGMVAILLAASQKDDVVAIANLEGNLRLEDGGASTEIANFDFSTFQSIYIPDLLERLRHG